MQIRRRTSVVIAAHQAGASLASCLDALARSSIRPFEIIVVDDGSTDDTATVAQERKCRVLSTGTRSGPARARNLGAAEAAGEILVFLDSDVRVHPETLRRLISHFADPAVGAVFGAYDDAPADPGFFSRYRNLLHCHTHRIGRANASTFWAGCGAIRRELFDDYGGFDVRYEHASIEDVEFGARLVAAGVRIHLDPEAKAQHLKRWTFSRMWRADVFHRGIPWTRLILERRKMPDDLNVRWSQRISVCAAWTALLGILSGEVWLGAGAAALVGICNWSFLSFLRKRAGAGFALSAFPVQILFSLYCGFSFVAGVAVHLKSALNDSPVPLEKAQNPARY